jgi:hypothetical protein
VSRPPITYTPLQFDLMVLLPQDGQGMSVNALARASGISAFDITDALFDPYMAKAIDYDVRSDSYSLPRASHQPPPTAQ